MTVSQIYVQYTHKQSAKWGNIKGQFSDDIKLHMLIKTKTGRHLLQKNLVKLNEHKINRQIKNHYQEIHVQSDMLEKMDLGIILHFLHDSCNSVFHSTRIAANLIIQ